jgi:hypothetical protein
MYQIKPSALATAIAGACLLMGTQLVHAEDSNTVLLKALLNKGILTEDEYAQITKDQVVEKEQDKNRSKGITISDYLDDVKLTGDIRARYEYRKASGQNEANPPSGVASEQLDRGRYAYHIGFVTSADKDFFAELRFASNNAARSPNVTFSSQSTNGYNDKSGGAVNVDRAYVGWNITDWATVVAGRMKNDLYKTVMKFDSDITPEGVSERFKYKFNDQLDFFGSLNQWAVSGTLDEVQTGTPTVTTNQTSGWEYLEQVGAHYKFDENKSAKVAVSYESYTSPSGKSGVNLYANFNPNAAGAYGTTGTMGVNNLSVIDIPAEFNVLRGNTAFRLWADYAYNFDADKRAIASGIANAANFKNENTAYLVGLQVGSAKDLKTWEKQSTYWGDTAGMGKGDWSGRLWWQHIEAFAVNQNQIDSDIMNAMVNMEGWAASGIYMLGGNFFSTVTYAHGSRINSALGTGGSLDTTKANIAADNYNLLQLDLTYKF